MTLYFFVSEFVKICKSFVEYKSDFDNKEADSLRISHLRRCLKAIFSLLHLTNNHILTPDQCKFNNLNAYFEFLDRNISYAIAYVKVVGGSLYFPDLAKSLIKSKICSEKMVLQTILNIKEVESNQPDDYYNALIHIAQDNL